MPNPEQPQPPIPSLSKIIYSAVNLARMCLRMDVAFVTEFKDGRRIFRHIATTEEFMPVKVGDSDPLAESYCQYIVNGRIPAIVDDSHIYPILKALKCTESLKIRAHLGVPIRLSDGSIFGTFCCYSRNPISTLRDTDVQALARFAELIAIMLENRVYSQRAFEATSSLVTEAICEHALHIAYQPIVDLATSEVVGFEALARFQLAPQRGPDKWFEDAHRVSRGIELELLAIKLAIANMEKISPHAYVALNVSPQTILSGLLSESLTGAPLYRLVLEVTEHVPIDEYENLSRALESLRQTGLRLAIDDAGSGYASFRHILQLRPDIIKLDQSLIRNINLDAGRRALASALITFAKDTGSKVVAEGVETHDELGVLRNLGVQAAQGYLLGYPASVH